MICHTQALAADPTGKMLYLTTWSELGTGKLLGLRFHTLKDKDGLIDLNAPTAQKLANILAAFDTRPKQIVPPSTN